MDYLCKFGDDIEGFHRNAIIPLCWFGFGSVKELLELPISLLNRYARVMEEEGMVEKYWSYKEMNAGRR